MTNYEVLKQYYMKYLIDVKGLADSSVNHYMGALRTISKYLTAHEKVNESIFEVNEINDLEEIKKYLFAQQDFMEKDKRGNQMYSAGLNNYIRFAKGEVFSDVKDAGAMMDIEVPLPDKTTVKIEHWSRNGIIKKQTIMMAHYLCELNPYHATFIAASTGEQYMEGHHIIAFKSQGTFNVSLDVYANIICLCPICHRLLHYGLVDDKIVILSKIYAERADRLAKSGIRVSKDEFLKIVV